MARILRTGDEIWKALAHRWSHVFAVLFAVGAISGTVLSFELGLLWPEFMRQFGPVIGFAFAMEGFAFFLEAIFVGIYLYGWNRLGGWTHWWCGVPIAISGAASAWFVVTVSSFMSTPSGFRLVDGRAVDIEPLAALLNPSTGPQTAHMLVAAYIVAGFMVAAVYARSLLVDGPSEYRRRGMVLALTMGAVMMPVQFVVGDWAARRVAQSQPIKLAALEGQFQTEARAPLRIGGIPDAEARTTRYAIEIPGMLSWLGYRDVNAVVKGLDDFPPSDTPPVATVHIAFQVMVGLGVYLLGISLYAGWYWVRHRSLPEGRRFLRLLVLAGPLSIVALEAGWIVTEVGRQPYLVHGVVRTADMVTRRALRGLAVIGYGLDLWRDWRGHHRGTASFGSSRIAGELRVAPESILLVVVFAALTIYALLGGADFGAGVWEVNTALQASPKERKLLYSAIGPVWEANHVWLIFVLVATFGAFPTAFAAICQALWLPLLLALAGIVFRGAGYALRSYSTDSRRQEFTWGVVFAAGSTAAPFFLGASIGALASGKLMLTDDGHFDGNFLTGWLSPMSVFSGFFVVVMCAYLAAVFLRAKRAICPTPS